MWGWMGEIGREGSRGVKNDRMAGQAAHRGPQAPIAGPVVATGTFQPEGWRAWGRQRLTDNSVRR